MLGPLVSDNFPLFLMGPRPTALAERRRSPSGCGRWQDAARSSLSWSFLVDVHVADGLSVSGCFSGDAYSVHRYVMFTGRIKRIFS